MLKIKKLLISDFSQCYDLIASNKIDKKNFENIGWSKNQFKLQFLKENHLGLGLFNEDILYGFLIGDLINVEKKIEYEILLIYVDISERKLGYANLLLNNIYLKIDKKKLEKIYLEVASNNIFAIKLYEKNGFKKKSIRKKYYRFKDEKIDAYLFEKIVHE